jgi:hypothetical protein
LYYGWHIAGPTIPAGTVVDSHYIWLNSPGGVRGEETAIYKFDGPILGIIGQPDNLFATNGTLGFDVATAPAGLQMVSYTPTVTGNCEGLNPCFVNETTDLVSLLAPAVLKMTFQGFAGDYIRVLTAANVPLRPGDFDQDYDVDASDYVMWREGNINGGQGYIDWRSNLGYWYTFPGPGGGGESQLTSAVPEPATYLHIAIGGYFCFVAVYRSFRRRVTAS